MRLIVRLMLNEKANIYFIEIISQAEPQITQLCKWMQTAPNNNNKNLWDHEKCYHLSVMWGWRRFLCLCAPFCSKKKEELDKFGKNVNLFKLRRSSIRVDTCICICGHSNWVIYHYSRANCCRLSEIILAIKILHWIEDYIDKTKNPNSFPYSIHVTGFIYFCSISIRFCISHKIL